ncbi:MAG: methyltransferase domain-containing protein [Flavobacteriaceae bacterium]|nr:class I SAM-dependent methyltransferase [Bacteroidia bacterium]NNK87993.1 methyltransferase domain-containing protein [Flavobacteriaceae bacterium]
MRRLIWAYLKFLMRSKNQHGVHSPFVFSLITKCLYDKTKYKAYNQLSSYRRQLLNDKSSIEVSDLGPGSQVIKSKNRIIRDIARIAGTTPFRARMLFRLTRYFESKRILELGTSLGLGTQAMSLGNPEARIRSIEGCPNIRDYSQNHFKTMGITNVEFLQGDFDQVLDGLKSDCYDLIFIDGNHQKLSTLNYFNRLLKQVHNDSVMIFDDIHWSPEMEEAWHEIRSHDRVTVSIDTFFWGLVFFRKEQPKQHFTIRV